jgi:hypothetical protein
MALIPLTKGKFAIVDDEDFERVAAFKWTASLESRATKWYAVRWTRKHERGNARRVKVRLSHFVLGIAPGSLEPGLVVDHLNDDGLDNRKSNLRVCTQAENMSRVATWKRRKVEEPFL